ncbi:MAG: DUF4239 domain-containing protein [Paracoccaceae bacterium]
MDDLLYRVDFRLLAFLTFLAFAAAAELGLRLGLRAGGENDGLRTLMNGVGAAMLGILGLLLGFTMSMAVARWDDRHQFVVEEANAIGTLWLRAGLLDSGTRDDLRATLVAYTKTRIDFASGEGAAERIGAAQQESDRILAKVWSDVEGAAAAAANPAVISLTVSAANDLIDLSEKRLSSYENHLPPTVMFLLVFLGCVALGFIGWSFGAANHRRRSAILVLAFSLVLALTFLMDLNRPQRGAFVVGVKPFERLLATIAPPG